MIRIEQKEKENLKESYFEKKEELDEIRDNITLQRWKILSKAYKIGKKVWGMRFTRERLAFDMEVPYTTVTRCLALDRANPTSWKLVKEGKLSVFKLAQVCNSKNKTFQDEIVKMIIKDNLSTYQIKGLKINNLKDVNKERLRIACEEGYSRKSSAYLSFCNWMTRGESLLVMNKDYLPSNKIKDVEDKLKELSNKIERYLK